MTDWSVVDEHPFVGMSVRAEPVDGEVVEGEIAAIHEFDGEPRRLDVARADGPPLNIDRDRVEVTG